MVPLLQESLVTSALSHASLCPDEAPVALGIECSLRKRISHFQGFLSSETSRVLPRTPYDPASQVDWTAAPTVYGEGIAVTNYFNLAVLKFAVSAEPLLQEAMLVLLNESRILPLVNLGRLPGAKVAEHYFWKDVAANAYKVIFNFLFVFET